MDLIDLPEQPEEQPPLLDLPPLVEEDPILADGESPLPVDVADVVDPSPNSYFFSRAESLAGQQETPPDPSLDTLMDAFALGPGYYAAELSRYVEFVNAQNHVENG